MYRFLRLLMRVPAVKARTIAETTLVLLCCTRVKQIRTSGFYEVLEYAHNDGYEKERLWGKEITKGSSRVDGY